MIKTIDLDELCWYQEEKDEIAEIIDMYFAHIIVENKAFVPMCEHDIKFFEDTALYEDMYQLLWGEKLVWVRILNFEPIEIFIIPWKEGGGKYGIL